MQNFQYNYFKKKYGDKDEIFLTDTASGMNKGKLKMLTKIFTKIKSYLTSIIT